MEKQVEDTQNKISSHTKEQMTRKVKGRNSDVMSPSLTLGRNVEEVKTSEQAKAKKATVATSESARQVAQTSASSTKDASTSSDVRKVTAEEVQKALEEMKSKPVGSLRGFEKNSS